MQHYMKISAKVYTVWTAVAHKGHRININSNDIWLDLWKPNTIVQA